MALGFFVDSNYPMPTPVDDLFSAETGRLLAAVGNNETKALLLVAMQPGHVYLAWALRRLLHDLAVDKTRLTQAGMMVGPVSYMPPERWHAA
jgi:hypothetical protein